MSQTRNDLDMDIDNEQTESSLLKVLDLPPEIIYRIPAMAHPDNDHHLAKATRVMATLSGTCKPWYSLFQPELVKRAAKQLLLYVLQGNKAATIAAVK
jgi:hypothetical protein